MSRYDVTDGERHDHEHRDEAEQPYCDFCEKEGHYFRECPDRDDEQDESPPPCDRPAPDQTARGVGNPAYYRCTNCGLDLIHVHPRWFEHAPEGVAPGYYVPMAPGRSDSPWHVDPLAAT